MTRANEKLSMKKSIVPRVAAIQDISGFGRCSLTVIIPILSCMGVQVCPLPTAILSTHSGGFGEMAFSDLTNEMKDYMAHWKSLNLYFDYIYTGFLGNEKQINQVVDFCKAFKRCSEQKIVVDPVMGDNGKLYRTYNEKMQNKMRHLVEIADIITPNLTEVAFLLKREYRVEPMTDGELKELLKALSDMGPKIIVITGAIEKNGSKVNVAYDKEQESYWKIPYDEVPTHYPGTGDCFTSVLIGALIQGDSLPMAIERATRFVSLGIKTTYGYCSDNREGIMLERILPSLFNKETEAKYSIM